VVPAEAGLGRFRIGYIGPYSPDFLRPKQDLLPAKAVLLPSQAGSTTACHQPWYYQPTNHGCAAGLGRK
jgi:hypothetical protein